MYSSNYEDITLFILVVILIKLCKCETDISMVSYNRNSLALIVSTLREGKGEKKGREKGRKKG